MSVVRESFQVGGEDRSCLAGAKPLRHTVYVNWYRQINSDPALRPDGINVLQILTQNAREVRKLFWSHKWNAQRAARDGDYKYLKILDNTFLFNVVEDPMERANLKERRKVVYDRIVAEWREWNVTMLPEINDSSTGNFSGDELADHIDARETNGKADNPMPPKMPESKPH